MKLIPALLVFLFPCVVEASSLPAKQSVDARMTHIKYNPEDVVRVRTKVGVSTLIQLATGERIVTSENNSGSIAIGDSEAWELSHVGNNIFLKPKAEDPDTNLIVTTNKGRTYVFQLVESKFPHYLVKMTYDKPISSDGRKNEVPCFDGSVNFNYDKWGHSSIAPNHMWDDGRFTCLKFNTHAEIPVIYKVSADKTESLVNYHFEDDIMVLHTISKEYRLRLGKLVMGLKSEDVVSSGFNNKASSIKATRELIRE